MGFSEIENEVVSRLRTNEPVYRELWEQRLHLLQPRGSIFNSTGYNGIMKVIRNGVIGSCRNCLIHV